MAKEIIIPGLNLLTSLADAWGGENRSGETQRIYGTDIPDGYKWGMNFEELERFIKTLFNGQIPSALSSGKIGCLRTWEDGDEELHLLGFASLADYETWFNDHEAVSPITDIIIPKGGGAESAYSLTLEGTAPAAVQMNSDFSVRLKANYLYNSGGASQEMPDWVTLTVQSSTNNQTWVTRGQVVVQPNRFNYVSMKGLLPNGNIYVRIMATAEKATSPIPFVFQTNIVNLTLMPATAFQVPFDPEDSALTLQYYLTGSVAKTLLLSFDGGAQEMVIDNITGNYSDTPFSVDVPIAEVLSPGRHTVAAQLKYSDDVHTEWVLSEYMVSGGNTALVAINNISTDLANWTDVHFLDWMVHTPDGTSLDVVFVLVDAHSGKEYARWPFSGKPRTKYQFTTQLAIDGVDDTYIDAKMLILDTEGNELHEPVNFGLENEESFAPTQGATFVVAPSIRSNAETDPATIINTVTGEVVATSECFEGFDWNTDGWIAATYNGADVRVLRIPAGRKLTIPYNPMLEFTGGDNTGKSMVMELDFMVNNVVDDTEPLITLGAERSNGTWWGFKMLPLRAMLLTVNKYTEPDQDLGWSEGRRFHLAISAQYGGEGVPNYVRIYLDGVMQREFAYETDDRFTPEGVGLVIGNTGSDIDIFGLRCYRTALSSVAISQDYKAAMSTTAEKIAFADANDILDDSGRIDWDKCLGKYNIIGHRGRLLHYGMENNTQHGVELEIHMPDDEEHSGILTNLDNKGQGTTAMTYYYWNQQYKTTDETQFLDFEGNPKQDVGSGYAIQSSEYQAKKLVGKVNFASSMQSHKLGLTRAYTDVFKQMVKDGNMSTPGQFATYPDARLAVLEKPFLFFVWNEDTGRYEFQNLMTFGAGKGDKPTFGFNKKTTPHMLMVEGADNDVPLARFNMPWDDTNITYNAEKETWDYNGAKNINFGFGLTDDNGIPSDADAKQKMRDFFNFVYLHSTKMEFFNGSLDALQRTEGSRLSPLRWLTGSYACYRYDEATKRWVPAGIDNQPLDLVEQYEAFTGEAFNTSQGNQAKNEAFKKARLDHFKAHAAEYFHVDDALYHYCFIKLVAGTDNRCKNTYYYTDPVTLLIRWMQDDVDTVYKTNNVGQNRKPYWVEEHTKDENGENYWQAEDNVFYCLLEEAWDRDTPEQGQPNIQQTMRNMLSAMATLGGGSVMGFVEKYLLSTQDYFPAAAYNEMSRAVYETSYRLQMEGTYKNDTNALSQSCGSQRWSEYQWLVDRIMYISSWCQYGEFASSTAAGGLSWRGATGTHIFKVTPAKYMYPRIAVGSSNAGGTALRAPGEEHVFNAVSSQGDTTLTIRGNDYLFKLGDMDQYQTVTEFGFAGRRLQEITVNPNGTNNPVRWSAPAVRVTATNIKRYVQRNTPSVSGTLDLSACVRLEEINVQGTSFTSVKLPSTGSLKTVALPGSLESLTLVGCRSLEELSLGADVEADYLQDLTIKGSPAGSAISLAIVREALSHLKTIDIDLPEEGWTLESDWGLTLLNTLASMGPFCRMQGEILIRNVAVSFEDKRGWVQAWGDVDHGTGGLKITYPVVGVESVRIRTGKYLESVGDHQLEIDSEGNDFTAISWSMSVNRYATIDPNTGIVTVNSLVAGSYADITVRIVLVNGTELSDTKRFYFEEHECQVGDYVYADGTFSDELLTYKTAVAQCFYVNPNDKTDRLAVALKDTRDVNSKVQWGLVSNAVPGATLGDYDCYDTPVNNISTNGVNDVDDVESMAAFANYGSDTAIGDFRMVQLTEDIGGYKAGVDSLHVGHYKTLKIIQHRNKIIRESTPSDFTLSIPAATANTTETDSLTDLIAEIKRVKGDNYRTYYYPAASYCYAYEPTGLLPGETLSTKLKAHKWFLPTLGELARIYWLQQHDTVFNASYNAGQYKKLWNDWYWTSTEINASNAYTMNGGSGQVINYYYFKSYSYLVRAVVAF